jgi:peptide/nickel transport system permease protein
MRQLLTDLRLLWEAHAGFKASALFLCTLIMLIILLPILPLPYGPNDLDLTQTFQEPFSGRAGNSENPTHWLGSDALGRDVLANILYGGRSAFMVSFPIMLLSTIIGLIVGISAGYFGNGKLKISRAGFVSLIFILLLGLYFGLYLPIQLYNLEFEITNIALSIILLILLVLAVKKLILPTLKQVKALKATTSIPLDYLVVRLIESLNSIPNLLLILVIVSFFPPSVLLLSIIIISVTWTSIARFARAEIMKIMNLPYFEAGRSIGLTQRQLLFRHALPNMLGPIVVTFTFGLAGLLALESTLSFLGIGVPSTFVSWGRTIAGIRSNTAAWWLATFPGAILALTVLSLQTISYHFLNMLQNRDR